MFTISSGAVEATMSNRKLWTVDECDQLERYGFLPDKYELLDGEIIDKMGQHQPHGLTISRISFWLMSLVGTDRVLAQASANAARPDQKQNRPEPDIAVYRAPTYELDMPIPALTDAVFVVEVADTTLTNDLGKKAALYARANVPEYWVMDITGRRLIVHLLPVEGNYTDIRAYDEESLVAPRFAMSNTARVGDLLSPVPKS